MSNCPFCQTPNRSDARFCQNCGKKLSQHASPPSTKAPLTPTKAFSPADMAHRRTRSTFSKPKGLSDEEARQSMPQETREESKQASTPHGQKVWQVKTEPLPSPKDLTFTLPLGELLDNRRYAVLAILREGSQENVYSVWDRQQRYCPQCHSSASHINDLSCRECGGTFSGKIEHPKYFLRETLDAEMWQREVELTEMGLSHPGLINLHRTFKSRYYGGISRFYLLSDSKDGQSLKTISTPLPEETVLEWGQQLAETLTYLHRKGIVHRDVRLENIFLINNQIKLDLLKYAEKVPQDASNSWNFAAQEVERLGSLLQKLIDPLSLSAATSTLFDKLFSKNNSDFYPTAEAFAKAIDEVLSTLYNPRTITHLVGHVTDLGRKRKLNEDSLLALAIEPVQLQMEPIGLYVVADGMGGHAAGDVASQLAAQTMRKTISSKLMRPWIEGNRPQEDVAILLKEACLAANRAVYEQSRTNHSDMGTTLAAVLLVGNHAYIANVGDSRVYLVNRQAIQQLTVDHSLVERLVTLKQITPEQARHHPQRHVILRTIGDKPEVEVDLFEYRLKNGDNLIVCSDGLHGMITDQQIQQIVIQSQYPQQAAEQLVELANQAGGNDNISVIAVKIKAINSRE